MAYTPTEWKDGDVITAERLLCLVMMVALTAAAIVMCAVTKTPLDAGVLGVLMGGWCGELLLTLLKRRFEVEDKRRSKDNNETEGDET